jgi:hypothetical protein
MKEIPIEYLSIPSTFSSNSLRKTCLMCRIAIMRINARKVDESLYPIPFLFFSRLG